MPSDAALCDSHLWPRRIYALLHDPGDPKHFTLGNGRLTHTMEQMHEYLLCDECEERFNSGGERRRITSSRLETSGALSLRTRETSNPINTEIQPPKFPDAAAINRNRRYRPSERFWVPWASREPAAESHKASIQAPKHFHRLLFAVAVEFR